MCSRSVRQAASTPGVTAYMRAFMIPALAVTSALPRLLQLARTPRHVVGNRLAHRRIQGRRDILRQQLLPDCRGALGGVARTGLGPALEARPVRKQWPVERRLVACERVRGAEEMPTGGCVLDRIDREVIVAELERLEHLRPVAQQLGIDDDFFQRSGQPTLEPAGSVVD